MKSRNAGSPVFRFLFFEQNFESSLCGVLQCYGGLSVQGACAALVVAPMIKIG